MPESSVPPSTLTKNWEEHARIGASRHLPMPALSAAKVRLHRVHAYVHAYVMRASMRLDTCCYPLGLSERRQEI